MKRVAMAAILSLSTAFAQERTSVVSASDLLRAPQRYWAQRVVFADMLKQFPAGGRVALDRRIYIPLQTAEAGRCYVPAELAPVFEQLPADRRYHFEGTVIQVGRRFYITVHGVAAAIEREDLKFEWPAVLGEPKERMREQALGPVLAILTEAEGALVAYAREKGVDPKTVFDPKSPHYPAAMTAVRAAIRDYEQRNRMPASEILTGYLFQILAGRAERGSAAAEAAESQELSKGRKGTRRTREAQAEPASE